MYVHQLLFKCASTIEIRILCPILSSTAEGGGLELQFQSRPPLSSVPLNMSVTRDPDRNLLRQEEVHTILQKGAVELVNPPLTPGFYSRLFVVQM